MRNKRDFRCTIEAAMVFIGGKYKPVILWHLVDGEKRFGELQRFLPEATAHTLTLQLRELERDKLIQRKVYPVVPPKTEYSLTEVGRTLSPLLVQLREWGHLYCDYTNHPNPCKRDEPSEHALSDSPDEIREAFEKLEREAR